METNFFFVFLSFFFVGFISNFSTLLYIVASFDIRTHVFLLIFVDAFFSTICCFIGVVLDFFIVANVVQISFTFCTLSFFVSYFPTNFGCFITFLTSAVRYYLTIKSAKNIKPSKSKVSKLCLLFIALIMLTTTAWLTINLVLQTPFASLVDICINR